jgi:S-adenosylmethionine decarboxylase proenzyme
LNKFVKLGEHFICELSGCNQTLLQDNEQIRVLFTQLIKDGGLSVVGEGGFEFSPHGLTCYLILEESHASLHTWPEYQYCAIDLFTCNLQIDISNLFVTIQEAFGAKNLSTRMIERGTHKEET